MKKSWCGEKFDALSEERKAEVQARVEAGLARAREVFAARALHKKQITRGLELLTLAPRNDGRVMLDGKQLYEDRWTVGKEHWKDGRRVVHAVWSLTAEPHSKAVLVRVAFACCAPNDFYSRRVGRGMAAYRWEHTDDHVFEIRVSKVVAMSVPMMSAFIQAWFLSMGSAPNARPFFGRVARLAVIGLGIERA